MKGESNVTVGISRTVTDWHSGNGDHAGTAKSWDCVDARNTFDAKRYEKDVKSDDFVEFDDDEMQDYEIIGGFGGNYLMAERAGVEFASSTEVRFLQDQTVFKGTARYDGKPAIAEAFVVFGINGTTATTSMAFAQDKANA